MRQVLFRIPVELIASWFPDSIHFKEIAAEFPDDPPIMYLVLAVLALMAGMHFERRRRQEGWNSWANFSYVGGAVAAFFALVFGIKDGLVKDAPHFAYPMLALMVLVTGNLLERRRQEAGWQTKINFHYVAVGLSIVLALIWVAKVAAGFTTSLPIFGYGAMLFLAFIACTVLADRLAAREGIVGVHVQDLAIWIFIMGIVGARLTFIIQYHDRFTWDMTIIRQFFQVWDGGLVFYGSVFGGLAGYVLGYFFILRRHNVDSWKMADVIAPCVALGLALGRIGCLLNGCCFGNVATCPDCPEIHFGLSSPPRYHMVAHGFQTPAGFLTRSDGRDNREVWLVEPESPAAEAGLKPGDFIEKINGKVVGRQGDIEIGDMAAHFSGGMWPHGQSDLDLVVLRGGSEEKLTIRARTLGLHPTQLYETISMIFVFFLLLAFHPFRRQPGAVMVLFMFCYAVHRFLNEMLRTDTDPVWGTPMTLSQNISILVFVAAILLAVYLRIKWVRTQAGLIPPPPLPEFTGVPASGSEHLLSGRPALPGSAKRDENIRK